MIVAVVNLKGGSSKTTTAAFLAGCLHERGKRVIIIDADKQGSITRWGELAKWDIPVRGMATGQLHLPVGVAREAEGYDAVIIDTPPTEKESGIVESAIKAATHVVVPMAPTPAEYDRMAAVWDLIEDVAHLGRHTRPPIAVALLTRAVTGASSTGIYADFLREDGWIVLKSVIARLERPYAQSFGAPLKRANATAYGDALSELLALR